ncbi:MAG: hypothetical protein ABIA93_04520 [Candidatus Woesearchaeota archaeon]
MSSFRDGSYRSVYAGSADFDGKVIAYGLLFLGAVIVGGVRNRILTDRENARTRTHIESVLRTGGIADATEQAKALFKRHKISVGGVEYCLADINQDGLDDVTRIGSDGKTEAHLQKKHN